MTRGEVTVAWNVNVLASSSHEAGHLAFDKRGSHDDHLPHTRGRALVRCRGSPLGCCDQRSTLDPGSRPESYDSLLGASKQISARSFHCNGRS